MPQLTGHLGDMTLANEPETRSQPRVSEYDSEIEKNSSQDL